MLLRKWNIFYSMATPDDRCMRDIVSIMDSHSCILAKTFPIFSNWRARVDVIVRAG